MDRIAQNLPVDRDAFVSDCLRGFEPLSLMDRARHVADVMHDHLDPDPATAVTQVARSLGTDRPHGMDGFFYNPHSFFIARYGLPAFEESMAAQYELTKLFTAEFCIRPFIVEYPQTMDTLRTWTGDPDEHVRRLVSEGTRPRLPWATRLPQFQRDPGPVLELLDRLKDDGSEYVRRSGPTTSTTSRRTTRRSPWTWPGAGTKAANGWSNMRCGLCSRLAIRRRWRSWATPRAPSARTPNCRTASPSEVRCPWR